MSKIIVNWIVDLNGSFCNEGQNLLVPGAEEPKFRKINQDNINSSELSIFTLDTHDPDEYSNSEESKEFPLHCDINDPEQWNLVCEPRNITPENLRQVFLDLKLRGINPEDTYYKNEQDGVLEVFIPKNKFSVWEGNSKIKEIISELKINPKTHK